MMNPSNDRPDNYYDILGVDPKCAPDEVRRAYRAKIKQWHPDINVHRIGEAEEMTKVLNQAYTVLGDPARRKQYDRMLRYTRNRDFNRKIDDRVFWQKLRRASPTFRKILESVRELYGLFHDAVDGRYKLHPVTLGIVGGGLLYFILPADLIPDVLPVVGFIDDLAVLTTIVNSLQNELAAYRNWRSSTGNPER